MGIQNKLNRIKDKEAQSYGGSAPSAYQANLANNYEADMSTPTLRSAFGKIMELGQTDKKRAKQAFDMLSQLQQNPSSVYYNPYATATNRSVANLQAMGINTGLLDDDWFQKNSYLKQYYIFDGTTNTPSKPGKKATAEQMAAYEYYQLDKSREDTKKAQQETEALKQELTYWAQRPDRNYSDDEILNKIDWNKYKTLAKMDETKAAGAPMELNTKVDYSKDWMYGVLWAARNGGGTGSSLRDMANSALGIGNTWQEDPELYEKINPKNKETYSPYSVGSTLEKEGLYFGMYSFDQEWLDNNWSTALSSNDKTLKEMYNKVYEAEQNTQAAESELKDLKDKVSDWLDRGLSEERILKKLEAAYKDYKTLAKMDKSLETGELIGTTRAIDYRKQDILNWIHQTCEQDKAEEENANNNLSAYGVGAVHSIRGTSLNDYTAQAIHGIIADGTDSLEEVASKNEVDNWFHSPFLTVEGAVKNVKEFVKANATATAKANVRSNARAHLYTQKTIEDYENAGKDIEKLETMNQKIEEQLGNKLGALSGGSYGSVDVIMNTEGGEVTATLVHGIDGEWRVKDVVDGKGNSLNEMGDEFYEMYGYLQPRLDAALDHFSQAGEWASTVDANSITAEDEALYELYEQNIAAITQKSNYIKNSQEDYNNAVAERDAAERSFNLSMQAMHEAGLDTTEMEKSQGILDIIMSFSQPVVSDTSIDNWCDDLMRTMYVSGGQSNDFKEQNELVTKMAEDIPEQIKDIQWLINYIDQEEIDVPEDYINHMQEYILELENRQKAYDYYQLMFNENFESKAADGQRLIESFSGRGQGDPTMDSMNQAANQMDDSEKQIYYYLYRTQGKNAASEYYAFLNETVLGKRALINAEEAAKELNETSPVLANAAAIAFAPVDAIAGAGWYLNGLINGKLDENSAIRTSQVFSTTVYSENMEAIANSDDLSDTGKYIAKILYSNIYNRGRSLVNSLVFGGFGGESEIVGAFPMAIGAAAQASAEAIERGANDGQALIIGLATFGSESVTEGIRMKHLDKALSAYADPGTFKEFLLELVPDMLAEMTGETLNEISEKGADYLVMWDKSEIQQSIENYKSMGYSQEEAESMTMQDNIDDVVFTAISSLLSPTGDTAFYAAGRVRQNYRYSQINKYVYGGQSSVRELRQADLARLKAEQEAANQPEEEYVAAHAKEETEEVKPTDEEYTPAHSSGAQAYNEDTALLDEAAQAKRTQTRTTTMAALLSITDSVESEEQATAAAVHLGDAFGEGVNAITETRTLVDGARIAGIEAGAVKQGIQIAALSASSQSRQVLQSQDYVNATPQAKAEMLTEAFKEDSKSAQVATEMNQTVFDNRVAEVEKQLISQGAAKAVEEADYQAKHAAEEENQAINELANRRADHQAKAETLVNAYQELADDSRNNRKRDQVTRAVNEVTKAATVAKEYEQSAQNKQQAREEAEAKATRVKRETMLSIRQQAEQIVAQQNVERAQAREQQIAEQAQADARAAEAQKVEQEHNNVARLTADDFLNQEQFKDLSKEDRQEVRRMFKQVQKQLAPEALARRGAFAKQISQKYGVNIRFADTTKGGKVNRQNGSYNKATNTLTVDKRATMTDLMYAVMGHELTHMAELSDTYDALAAALLKSKYGDDIGKLEADKKALMDMYNKELKKMHAQDETIDDTPLKPEDAQKELVANIMGDLLKNDKKLIDRLVETEPSVARRILNAIKSFLKKLTGIEGDFRTEAQKLVDSLETALNEAAAKQAEKDQEGRVQHSIPEVTDEYGIPLITELEGGTAAINQYSLSSFDTDEQAKVRSALLRSGLYTADQVDKYMDDALGIAAKIAADRTRLDFKVTDENQSMIKPNADYGASVDASTLCAKRLLYQGTFDAIQHALPNTPLTPDDLIELANMMRDMGFETPCGICYVESRRKTLGLETEKWLKNYKGEYIPRIDELTTSDGLDKLRVEHPQAHADYLEAMKKLNQRNPKVVQLRTEYKGEIKDMTDAAVQKAINHGGLRIQSFSDFETPHLLDMVQVVYDMAARGLSSQAYTKVPNFAWVFGGTGMKINLSLIAKGDGVDANGKLLFDDVEGMPYKEAMRLRRKYSQNVGTILVGKSDAHILAAMASNDVDFIIPFHRSGWTKKERALMETLKGYQDYTNDQNERKILKRKANGKGYQTVPAAKSGIRNFEPVGAKEANGKGQNGYWDFTKTGTENAETYLEMCAKDGRIPKFSRFLIDNGDGSFRLPTEQEAKGNKQYAAVRKGYWKTLIDFKMYDNKGVGSPQTAVTPNINMTEAYRVLKDYKLERNGISRADNNTNPVAPSVVEKFVEARKEREAANLLRRGTAAGLAGGGMTLGNTQTEQTEQPATAARAAMAINAETGETERVESYSLLDDILSDVDKMLMDMSPEELGLDVSDTEEAKTVLTNAVQDLKQEFDPTIYNGKLYVKPETMQHWLSPSGFASTNKNYAQAYITTMDPKDYLRMTTATEEGQQRILDEATPLDEGRLAENAERQPIQLLIDEASGKVTGHEGRHRAVALARAGVTEMPVLLFDFSTKYDKTRQDEMTLQGQTPAFRDDIENGNTYTFQDVIPLSAGNADEITGKYTASEADQQTAAANQQRVLQYSLPNAAEMDEAYEAAYNAYDDEEGARLVAEAAEAAMPNSVVRDENGKLKVVYHQTNGGDFTVFDIERARSSMDVPGFFFAPEYDEYHEYGDRTIAAYLDIKNPKYDVFDLDFSQNEAGLRKREELIAQGYDGIINTEDGKIFEYVAFYPEQVKSAEAFTEDDDGNLIPLSERFNSYEPDIRYSLPQAVKPEDADYLSAVDRGELDIAQRLVDQKAKAAGYSLETFHGTGEYFNEFRRGFEGIHLGNREQAEQVASIRYDMRSKKTDYKWTDIRDSVGNMNEEQRESLTQRAYQLGDYFQDDAGYVYPYDGDLSDTAAVTKYVDDIVNRYEKATGANVGSTRIRMNTFDRKTGQNVMRLYAKINNPFVINGDINTWSPSAIARVILQRAEGITSIERYGDTIDITGTDVTLTPEQEAKLRDLNENSYEQGQEEKWDILSDILNSMGFDGIKYLNQYEGDQNSYSYIALRQSDVKRADTVTYDDQGNPIPLSERFNTESPDIRYSLPQAVKPEDADYLSAVEHGETDWALQLLDEAAYKAGYTVGAYHGTNVTDIDVFNTHTENDKKTGWQLLFGTHFTQNPEYAKLYARKAKGSKGTGRLTSKEGRIYDVKLNLGKSLDLRTAKNYTAGEEIYELYNKLPANIKKKVPMRSYTAAEVAMGYTPGEYVNTGDMERALQEMSPKAAENFLRENGYNSVLYNANYGGGMVNNMYAKDPSIIMLDPERIKEFGITYDNDGNVIPLSERFNQEKESIRYSLPSDDILRQQILDFLSQQYGNNGEEVEAPAPRQREFGQKLQPSELVPEDVVQYIQENNWYDPDTNSAQVDRAVDWVRNMGFQNAVSTALSDSFNYASADGVARMNVLMATAARMNDTETQRRLMEAYNTQRTEVARALQAGNLFRLMTPDGREAAILDLERNMNNELASRGVQGNVQLSDETIQEARNAQTDEDFHNVQQHAAEELVNQLPVTWKDRLQAWRMLSMLGNPRTHVRNLTGNFIFLPVVRIKDEIGAGLERIMIRGSAEDGVERTKAFKASRENRAYAKQLVNMVTTRDALTGEDKYTPEQKARMNRAIFGTKNGLISKTAGKIMQKILDFNSKKLEQEDWLFLNRHFVHAMSGWMTANHLTPEDMTGPVAQTGMNYAIQEALKATYRDASKAAETLNKLSRQGGFVGFTVEAALPFKKTPANILKRGVEYSPVGLIRALTTYRKKVGLYKAWQQGLFGDPTTVKPPKNSLSPTQAIDRLASGLTGTAISALGAFLAATGAVTVKLDDPEDELKKLMGYQEYSISLFGLNFTFDWAAPVCMPFFTGAALYETYQDMTEDGVDLAKLFDALVGIADPVFNLSMLDGVNSLLNVNQNSAGTNLTQVLERIASNYVTSFVPTSFGAVARTIDNTRRRAYVPSGSGAPIPQYAFEQMQNKIPGWASQNIPYRNAWGEAESDPWYMRALENFLLPGYVNQIKPDELSNELAKVYEDTGASVAIPKMPQKSFTVNKETQRLTDQQWDQLTVDRGTQAKEILTELFSLPDWQTASDEDRQKMLQDAWDYSSQKAKQNLYPDYSTDKWVAEAKDPVQAILDRVKGRATKVAKSGYKDDMLKALDEEDISSYQACVAGLLKAGTKESTIKGYITTKYKAAYKQAYLTDDERTMDAIEDILDLTGFDFNVTSWEKEADREEDAKED